MARRTWLLALAGIFVFWMVLSAFIYVLPYAIRDFKHHYEEVMKS